MGSSEIVIVLAAAVRNTVAARSRRHFRSAVIAADSVSCRRGRRSIQPFLKLDENNQERSTHGTVK